MTDSTLDVASLDHAGSGVRADLLALMIAWSPVEPQRIGEIALFEPDSGARVLGRGEGDGSERVVFQRQRPGVSATTPPLASPGISREQLRVHVDRDKLHVRRIGRCPMERNGEVVDACTIQPGDTLHLRGQLLLHCTKRPFRMDPLKSASLENAPAFGEADRFGIVGESPAAWRLRDRIAWIAAADEHLLLLGASGSGKELCARAVHALSARAKEPFVARNAATIPDGIADAELFGNMKGYPNPGMPERPGLIGAAHRGTLFLDEIGELPMALQASLLRVIDEGGEYHVLGSSVARRSDLRLIGATNREAEALKHDLAARLVLRLDVPGLDDRRDDVPLLVRHLLWRAAEKSPQAVERFLSPRGPRLSAGLVAHLLGHGYATNVRELHALLWQAMGQSEGDTIAWQQPSPAAPSAPEPTEEQVRASLSANAGNVAKAARTLGLSSRYVLYRLMKRYGIAGDE
jgi:transcriptional regulator of acetoin/glycerol metabolism